MRKLVSLFALTTMATFGAACGSDDDNGVVLPDAAPQPDASNIDAAPVACQIDDYSATPLMLKNRALTVGRSVDPGPPEQVEISVAIGLPPEANADQVVIQAFEGAGPFENGYPIVDTVVEITGDEADPFACNLCLFIQADIAGGSAGGVLLPRSGTATIRILDNVEAGGDSEFDLDLSNVVFNEVDLDQQTLPDKPGGCTTTIGTLELELGIEAVARQPAPNERARLNERPAVGMAFRKQRP